MKISLFKNLQVFFGWSISFILFFLLIRQCKSRFFALHWSNKIRQNRHGATS